MLYSRPHSVISQACSHAQHSVPPGWSKTACYTYIKGLGIGVCNTYMCVILAPTCTYLEATQYDEYHVIWAGCVHIYNYAYNILSWGELQSAYFLGECGSGRWDIWSRLPPVQRGRCSQPQTSSYSMDEDHPLGSLPHEGLTMAHWRSAVQV